MTEHKKYRIKTGSIQDKTGLVVREMISNEDTKFIISANDLRWV